MDGQTDGRGATLNAAPREGHTVYHIPIWSERQCRVPENQMMCFNVYLLKEK